MLSSRAILALALARRASRARAAAAMATRTSIGASASMETRAPLAVDPRFWSWALKHGVEPRDCRPDFVGSAREGWRGVVATAPIAAGATLLRVPTALLMSGRTAAADDVLARALSEHHERDGEPPLTPTDRLAVHLLRELSRGAESFWHLYLRQLPRSYALTCGWTAAERNALQLPHAVDAADRSAAACRDAWARATPVMEKIGLPATYRSFGAWAWAAATISSRTVFVPFDAAGALCPVGDLFNYVPPTPPHVPKVVGTPLEGPSDERDDEEDDENDSYFSRRGVGGDGAWHEASDAWVFVARRDYRKGEEISLCYGQHTNLGLLTHYGFTMSHGENAHDEAPLVVDAKTLDVDFPAAVGDVGSYRNAHEICVFPRGGVSWSTLERLRLAAHATLVGKPPGKDVRERARRGEALGAACETLAHEAVVAAAAAALTSAPTTAAEDAEIVARMEAEGVELAANVDEPGGVARDGSLAEWARVKAGEEEEEEEAEGAAAASENMLLAVRWRLSYKRSVQAAYKLAAARVAEAARALEGGGASGAVGLRDLRIARPKTLRGGR